MPTLPKKLISTTESAHVKYTQLDHSLNSNNSTDQQTGYYTE